MWALGVVEGRIAKSRSTIKNFAQCGTLMPNGDGPLADKDPAEECVLVMARASHRPILVASAPIGGRKAYHVLLGWGSPR